MYNLYQEPKNAFNSTYVFLLWYFYLQFSAGNPAIFRVCSVHAAQHPMHTLQTETFIATARRQF
jgi:hypothetical protein